MKKMKKILLLLLFTIASYGQAVFDEGIQITNTESTTATKVNVQEANGKVNTKTINTAFNKNFGLNTGDVVGANTLLNQYSTTPLDWTATAYNSGQVVFYVGKQWVSKMVTVAGDAPAVSPKWEEITFEALANKTTSVDQTIIDGSNNAVSGNAVFDGLATKAPISSVHNPVTIGTANGLSLSTQQLSLGLASSSTTGALSGTDWNTFNGKFNTPTGLTTNYLPKWNGSGFGNSNIFDNGINVGVNETTFNLFGFGNFGGGVTSNLKFAVSNGTYINGFASVTNGSKLVFGYKNQLSSPNEMASIQMIAESIANNNEASSLRFFTKSGVNSAIADEKMRITPSGRILINKTDDDLTNQLQVAGTISASPATTANQVPTWGQVQAAAKPYKVYTALLTQTGTNAPVATVLENTLGETPILGRTNVGTYTITLTYPQNKTFVLSTPASNFIFQNIFVGSGGTNLSISTASLVGGTITPTDGLLQRTPIEIRIYP